MGQALQAGRLGGFSEIEIKRILDEIGKEIERITLDSTPPEMARTLQRVIHNEIGVLDPYKEIKKASNAAALRHYESVKQIVKESDDPLRTAIQAAIAGNIIDYGAVHDLDVDAELKRLMQEERMTIEREDSENFAYQSFRKDLERAENLVYVGDNAGEIVFDRILIETMQELYPELHIIFATRGKPILNDCLLEDAKAVGLDTVVDVVSSGVDTPGLILDDCSAEFLELFRRADLIISKGQGNFESLSEAAGPIYFLLIAKCAVVARELGCEIRDIILKKRYQ